MTTALPVFEPADSPTGGYMVSESLAAPMLPNVEHHATDVRNTVGVKAYYLETLLAEATVSNTGGERIAFVNKSFPHSRFDMMVLASSDAEHSAVTDMTAGSLEAILQVARNFVSFTSRAHTMATFDLAKGHFHMAFNFNRHTIDRENSMFYDKRFHLHLNYWPAADVRPARARRLDEITSLRTRRRLLDPLSFLAPQVAYERLAGTAGGVALLKPDPAREVSDQLPPGLKARLTGWDDLSNGTLAGFLTSVHRAADNAYREIFTAFTGQEFRAEPWWRPQLLDIEAIRERLRALDWLSESSAAALCALAESLRNIDETEIAALRDRPDEQIAKLAVASLDYSVSVFSASENVQESLEERAEPMVVVHFKMFSDIGGAGITWLPGVPIVKINRSSDTLLSSEAVAERRRFQDEFLADTIHRLDNLGIVDPGLFEDHRTAAPA